MVANRTRPTLEKRAKERARQEKRKQKEERRATAKARRPVLRALKARRIPISPESFPDRNRRRGATTKSFESSSGYSALELGSDWLRIGKRRANARAGRGRVPSEPLVFSSTSRSGTSSLRRFSLQARTPATTRLLTAWAGTTLAGAPREQLRTVMKRFSDAAASLVDLLVPEYRGQVERRRASFRPAEIAGRQTSWRKDDTRLHLDAFPASPTHGDRILRVFSNVNPEGRARTWRVGEEAAADRGTICRRAATAIPGSGRAARGPAHHQEPAHAVRRADAATARPDEAGRGLSVVVAAGSAWTCRQARRG